METRYYLALGVLLLWIAIRLGIILYRRNARSERLRQMADEEAEPQNDISTRSGEENKRS